MRKIVLTSIVFFLMFYIGTILLVAVDSICAEITGTEGKLVLLLSSFLI